MSDKGWESMGVWIAIGTAIGVGFGAAMDNMGAGIAIGTGIGVALGAAMSQQKKTREEQPDA